MFWSKWFRRFRHCNGCKPKTIDQKLLGRADYSTLRVKINKLGAAHTNNIHTKYKQQEEKSLLKIHTRILAM